MDPSCLPAHLEKLRNYIIEHPRLVRALDEILVFARYITEAPLIFLVGPPGVGKSRLARHLTDRMRAANGHRADAAVLVEAIANGKRSAEVALATLGREVLRGLRHPMFQGGRVGDMGATAPGYGQPAREPSKEFTRLALEEAVRLRRVKAIIVDEADALFAGNDGDLLAQIAILRSITNRSRSANGGAGLRFVFIGNYDLIDRASPTGTLARRGHVVHFAPYRLGHRHPNDGPDQSDETHFTDVLATFEPLLPFSKPSNLLRYFDFFLERTNGCVGTLAETLIKASTLSIVQGCDHLHERHIKAAAMNETQALQIRDLIPKREDLLEAPSDAEQMELDFGAQSSRGDTKPRRGRSRKPPPKPVLIGEATTRAPTPGPRGEGDNGEETAPGAECDDLASGPQATPPISKRRRIRRPIPPTR